MSLFSRLRRAFGGEDAPAPQASTMTMQSFSDWIAGQDAQTFTEPQAMSVSTVYGCVSLIGGAISSIPLHIYRRDQEGNRERIMPDLWWMLNEAPFPCWAAATAWEYATSSLLLHGDSFWRIHRKSQYSPEIIGFEPLHPMTVAVLRKVDRLVYRVGPQPSQVTGQTVYLDQDDVLHIAGPGFNGLRGRSQLSSVLRQVGASAKAADDYMASFVKNGARPDFVLEADGKLNSAQVELLRTQWEQTHGGVEKAWKPAVLSGGLKLKPITMTAADQQLLESRKFGVEEICRIFGVPPHMVGHTQASTSWGTGIEQMSLGFVKYTLQRHLVKFEQEINRKVFRTAARFAEFNTEGLLRGDFKTRMEGYRIALGRAGETAWMDVDEIRKLENLEPWPEGKADRMREGEPNEPAVPTPEQ